MVLWKWSVLYKADAIISTPAEVSGGKIGGKK